jgi:hypothetical protein
MCIILSAAILGPRAVAIIWWLFDSARWNAAFSTMLIPIIGILVLPWTTLAFVLASSSGSLTGLGLVVVIIGLFVDIGTYGSSAYSNKDKLGYQ